MGLRQRAKDAWVRHLKEVQAARIEMTRRLLRDEYGVREEEMETFEAAAIGMDWNDKTVRVDDYLFIVNDEGKLFVRDQMRKASGSPWKEIRNLIELGQYTGETP